MLEKIKWGIIAPGNIANRFAEGLSFSEKGRLYAVASNSYEKAKAFADKFGALRAYGSYDALIEDAEVDAVYIASPHPFHAKQAMLCLRGRKPVLCEKPLAINAREVSAMIEMAQAEHTFLMEGMWTRFFPAMREAKRLVESGVIGEVRMLEASFGFRTNVNAEGRLFDRKLAGGALLDVGIYTISAASLFLGTPSSVVGRAQMGETGVDEQNAAILTYGNGALAVLTSAIRTNTRHDMSIYGTEGKVLIPSPFWRPGKVILEQAGSEVAHFDFPVKGNGFEYEADHVSECIQKGMTDSDIMPMEESLSIAETMDQLREQWGLKYPIE